MLDRLFRSQGPNVDLHCHSVVSDGTLAPTDIVERAHLVVVGQREHVHAVSVRALDDVGRSERAVRYHRMAVQVDVRTLRPEEAIKHR